MSEYTSKIITQTPVLAESFAEAVAPYQANPEYTIHSNCYAYALGLLGHGAACPGRLMFSEDDPRRGYPDEEVTREKLIENLMKDGLTPITEDQVSTDSQISIIAGYYVPHDDFHFLRLHKDGYWSHQRGKAGKINMLDSNGHLITDPQQADHKQFRDFIGYFALPKSGIRYSLRP